MLSTLPSSGPTSLRRFARDLTTPLSSWIASERARSAAYRAEVFSNLGVLPED